MRPTSELSGEAWGEQPPASRTIPRPNAGARSTVTRSSADRTQPMSSRVPSSRTVPPSAARTYNPAPPASQRISRAAPPKQEDAEIERLGQQLVELMERLRASDERGAYLEQQLTHMTHMANAAAAAATSAAPVLPVADEFIRPRAPSNNWVPWSAFGLLGALVAAAYVFGYMPLRSSYEEQVKQSALSASQNAQALASLRASFAEERQRFESQLAAAQTATTAAAAPVEPSAPPSRTHSSAATSDDDDSGEHTRLSPEERAAKAAERAAKSEERKAAYEAKKAERLAKREERKAAAAERKAAREETAGSRKHGSSADDDADDAKPARASKPASKPAAESSGGGGDDPLQGLDGL
jgi:hypothetical protein